jgi:taurine dioxygenase
MADSLEAPVARPLFLGMQPGPRACVREERERLAALRFERIRVTPLAPTIGAEIEGVDLAQPTDLDGPTFAELRRAWLAYKVVFFRDQRIDARQQLAFARRFGELESHPFLPRGASHEEIVRFEKGETFSGYENLWHSDVSWREVPALGSVLRAIEVPEVGGDTLFSDMIAAYEGLDDATKARIEGRTATHDFSHSFGLGMRPEELAEKQKQFPAVSHPVVRTHPETGRRILYVNSIFTSRIDGLGEAESAELLERLCRQATVPEYQCRFRWRKDSVAFWDNRAVQHYAASDYWPSRRVMERVAIIGDRPRCSSEVPQKEPQQLPPPRSARLFLGDGEAEPQGIQQSLEAPELRIAVLGEHPVEVLPVQIRRLGELRDTSSRTSDIAQCQQEDLRIVVLEAGVQVRHRLRRILEILVEHSLVASGLTHGIDFSHRSRVAQVAQADPRNALPRSHALCRIALA